MALNHNIPLQLSLPPCTDFRPTFQPLWEFPKHRRFFHPLVTTVTPLSESLLLPQVPWTLWSRLDPTFLMGGYCPRWDENDSWKAKTHTLFMDKAHIYRVYKQTHSSSVVWKLHWGGCKKKIEANRKEGVEETSQCGVRCAADCCCLYSELRKSVVTTETETFKVTLHVLAECQLERKPWWAHTQRIPRAIKKETKIISFITTFDWSALYQMYHYIVPKR